MDPRPPRSTAPRLLHRPRRGSFLASAEVAAEAGMSVAGDPSAPASEEPILAMDEIQGNVIPGFGTQHIILLGLRVLPDQSSAAKVWLRDLTPLITSAAEAWHAREVRRAVAKATGVAPPREGVLLNVALSFEGAQLLGLPTDTIGDGLFRKGMTAADLQDLKDAFGRPLGWKVGDTPETTPHALVILGADESERLNEAVAIFKEHLSGSGLVSIYEELGAQLPGGIEHFGFRDGIAQPGVRGRRNENPESFVTRRYIPPEDPLSSRFSRPGEPLIWPGQFILGYPINDELSEEPGPIARPPASWMDNGSFLVFRRLHQDVAAFRTFAAEQAVRATEALGRTVTGDEVQALLVGRWPNGAPLVRCPLPPAHALGDFEENHFDYADAVPDTLVDTDSGRQQVPGAPGDTDGARCPHFAHVRKVNLRDKPTEQGPSFRFRVLRRGIPYGMRFRDEAPDILDRGLLFLSYQRDLQTFMTLSATWMNSAAAPEGFGHDLLVGQHRLGRSATRRDPAGPSVSFAAPPDRTWITPTGGGFFFSPARSVFASLT